MKRLPPSGSPPLTFPPCGSGSPHKRQPFDKPKRQ